MARDIYNTPAWRTVRGKVLERDGQRCQVRLPGCLGLADAVDHIVEVFEGGEPYELSNLQASCKPCNSRKHMRVLSRRASVSVREW